MIINTDNQAKGTRILVGEDANKLQHVVNTLELATYLSPKVPKHYSIHQVILPCIEPYSIYEDKDMERSMYVFHDKAGRKLCLRPEATASIQAIQPQFGGKKDIMLHYFCPCFRYDKPQKGRYRQFYQFGIEILNPSNEKESYKLLQALASDVMLEVLETRFMHPSLLQKLPEAEMTNHVKRGWDYYDKDNVFEIHVPVLGSAKQVCGGGIYEGGMGFAFGVDRLVLVTEEVDRLRKEEF